MNGLLSCAAALVVWLILQLSFSQSALCYVVLLASFRSVGSHVFVAVHLANRDDRAKSRERFASLSIGGATCRRLAANAHGQWRRGWTCAPCNEFVRAVIGVRWPAAAAADHDDDGNCNGKATGRQVEGSVANKCGSRKQHTHSRLDSFVSLAEIDTTR